ncbi:hypothetical protein AB0D71_41505 [Streptomyces avermitilis]
MIRWADARGLRSVREPELKAGMLALMCADVIRMHPAWLTVRRSRHFMLSMSADRDPGGFAQLEAAVPPDQWASRSGGTARVVICAVLATKGGTVQDCTVGDLMEIRSVASKHWNHATMLAYAWLRAAGQFPPDAPASLSRLETFTGQVSVGDLVDRYQLHCRPVRDVIVDYLTERQPSMDYNSLQGLSRVLASNFWADLERHHPGIDSLDLALEAAAGWKTRLLTKTVRRRKPNGTVVETRVPRKDAATLMMSVRAFYLDLAQWALEEPARWGQHAVRCPFSPVSNKKRQKRQKSWSHQRTREQLPHLPALVRAADQHLKDARARLGAIEAATAGTEFTELGETYRKARTSNWATDPHRTTTAYLQPDGRRPADRPQGRGEPSLLGLRHDRGAAAHRHPDRGNAGAEPPQHPAITAAHDRRSSPAPADRPVEDRRGARPAGHPRACRRPERDRLPDPRRQRELRPRVTPL